MSIQSDAAKQHILYLLETEYGAVGGCAAPNTFHTTFSRALREYRFHPERKWRFDFAVPDEKVAIELDGGTFQGIRTGHSSGVGLRAWREKNNAAMSAGWRVWHYAPEEVIKAGRKTLPDVPILFKLPWRQP